MRATTIGLLGLLMLGGCKKDPPPPPPLKVPIDKPRRVEPPFAEPSNGVVKMDVTDDGFVPANVRVKANEPVTLQITRKTDDTCATEILIDGTDINVKLPLNQPVEVAWTPKVAGSVKFGCAMDKMIGGILLVE